MAYIGRIPLVGNFQICDAISVVNGQAAYTMQVASVNVIPETAQNLIVSLNGVIQKPGSSYTVSGSTITFSQNLVTGDVIDFIQILGSVLDIGTPSDATVTTAKLGDNAVTTAKIGSGAVTSSKLSSGKVLNVVQGSKTAYTNTNSTSFSATGVKATITPSSTSSKVLVQVSLNGVDALGGTSRNASFKLYKGGSFLDWIIDGYGYGSGIKIGSLTYTKLVSPSTTSATEFEVFFAEQGGSGNNIGFNNFPSSNNVSTSTITLMEISA